MILLEVGKLYGSRMGYHGNILLRTMGKRGRDKKPKYAGGRGRDWDRKPNFVACSAWIVRGWVVVRRRTGSNLGLAANTYFVYLTFRTSALGMGQTVRPGKRNTLCCKSRMEMYFYLILWFFIYLILWNFYFLFLLFVTCLQNHQMMVTFLGRCCWSGRWVPQSLDCWSFCNVQGKMREFGEDDAKGMVSDIKGVQNLGGREM